MLPEEVVALQNQGYRWSAHSHPGTKDIVLDASGEFGKMEGDSYVLNFMQQQRSLVLNSSGKRNIFDQFNNYRVR